MIRKLVFSSLILFLLEAKAQNLTIYNNANEPVQVSIDSVVQHFDYEMSMKIVNIPRQRFKVNFNFKQRAPIDLVVDLSKNQTLFITNIKGTFQILTNYSNIPEHSLKLFKYQRPKEKKDQVQFPSVVPCDANDSIIENIRLDLVALNSVESTSVISNYLMTSNITNCFKHKDLGYLAGNIFDEARRVEFLKGMYQNCKDRNNYKALLSIVKDEKLKESFSNWISNK
ncbi:MAG: hypothetical protein MUE53_05620 [Chitinophagales bacterium]|nr:hypothetical protein [Chitinophagales bacterium]